MTRVPFTAEHARRLRFVRDAGFAGDGRHGFYTVAETVDETRETHGLWVFALDGSGARRLAAGLGDVGAPAPSPDGASLAVPAEIDGRRQICVVPVDGGPVRPLTALAQGVSGRPVWSPDGRSIAFTAGPADRRDPALPYRVDRATFRADGLGVLDDVVTDLHVVDVGTGAVRRLTHDRSMNAEPRWSPDGRSLCYLVSFPPDRPWTVRPQLHVLSVASGERTVLVDDWGGVFAAEWCADGTRITFVGNAPGDRFYATRKLDLWTIAVTGGDPECRTASVRAGVGTSPMTDLPVCRDLRAIRVRVRGDDAYVGGQAGGDAVVYRVALSGPEVVERAAGGAGRSFHLADADPAYGVLTHVTSFTDPPELTLGTRRVTALNDGLVASVERPGLRRLDVTAPDGVRSEAWALTPPGDGPWPAVLCVHGGPYSAYGSAYVIDFQLLAGAGFAVVFHNFRGSSGYGDEFTGKLGRDWGPGGALDHHAALDEAVRAGIADPDLLGVYGLSYGGFSACWLVGTSGRFSAAVAENPLTNLTAFFGEGDTAAFIASVFGGTPYDVPDVYRDGSPLTYAPDCTTPLLFIVGEDDATCTPGQSEQYYRVLKAGGVPAEMLRLPKSAHSGSWDGPVPARAAQNAALVEWFTRYLASPTDRTEAAR